MLSAFHPKRTFGIGIEMMCGGGLAVRGRPSLTRSILKIAPKKKPDPGSSSGVTARVEPGVTGPVSGTPPTLSPRAGAPSLSPVGRGN